MSLSVLGATFNAICIPGCMAVWLLITIASFMMTWRRGKRVPLQNNEDGRRHAALEAGASPAVADELARGDKIVAIKWYRMDTGASLLDAQNAVEHYERALYRYEPWPSVWAAIRGR